MKIDIRFEVPMPAKGVVRATPIVLPGVKRAVMVTPKETRSWQAQLAELAEKHLPPTILDEPLRVIAVSMLHRPKSLCRPKDPVAELWAPKKPDWDNIGKNAIDALKAFWRDDCTIVDGRVIKLFPRKLARPRLVIIIQSLEDESPASVLRELGIAFDDEGGDTPGGMGPEQLRLGGAL